MFDNIDSANASLPFLRAEAKTFRNGRHFFPFLIRAESKDGQVKQTHCASTFEFYLDIYDLPSLFHSVKKI